MPAAPTTAPRVFRPLRLGPALAMTMLVAAAGTATAASPGLIPVAGIAEQRLNADVQAVAAEAYVWGWPLAYVHKVREALERVPCPGRSGGMPVAPLNRLAMLADRATPRLRGVACPNQDVFYGFGMLDLEASPVVLQVPDFGGRFWLYQLGDQRTDAFADFGSMHGTAPGFHLVVGPSWAGTTPAGITRVVRSTTRYAYCLPRIFVSDSPGDREAALTAVAQVNAYPLDEFDGRMHAVDWSKARWLPDLTGRGRRGIEVSPDGFLDLLPDLLRDVPPRQTEEPLYARMRGLVRLIESDADARRDATAAIQATDRDVVVPLFQFRNVGTALPTGWTTLENGGAFGTDYLARTAVAKSNVFVNRRHETAYYFLDIDTDGERLDGRHRYRLTFPPGSLPPARGFWSLTVYDEHHSLPADATGRLSIGSRSSDLAYGADGSLEITIGPATAAADPSTKGATNHLTTPAGPFSLYLRLYWPETAAVEGTWTPPAVTDAGPAATSQDLAVSLTYVDFAGNLGLPGPANFDARVPRTLTGHHGGDSVLPGLQARQAWRR
jgi:hypothetical protein